MNAAEYFERDNFFEKAFKRQFSRVEDYRFRGYNSALGCFVESKEHYKRLMKQKGLVPTEEAERLAMEFDSKQVRKPLDFSPKALDIIRSIKATSGRNGCLKLGERAISALRSIGAIGNDSIYEPYIH